MSSNSSSSSSGNSFRYPFTANQWQELETQAHIFKYMVSGLPVPPDLIFSVKRSLEYSNSSMSSANFPTQPMGWGYFQMGYGRKVDPEPGRCRRTDGKKWRCSKEAYPDSKYCEKHMHRGRNRSRKHVEATSSQTLTPPPPPPPPPPTTLTPPPSSSNTNFSQSHILSNTLSASGNTGFSQASQQNPSYPFFMAYPSSSRQGNPGLVPPLTEENRTTGHHHHHFMNPGSSSSSHSERNYRYLHGMREGIVDERALFPGSSESERNLSHIYNQSSSHFQDLSGYSSQHHHHHQQEHNFDLGTSFISSNAENEEEKHKPLHHFFGK